MRTLPSREGLPLVSHEDKKELYHTQIRLLHKTSFAGPHLATDLQ